MLTLNTRVASSAILITPPVRVPVAAPSKRRFAQFLVLLMRALASVHS
jgi:hypothetical protein